MIRHTKSPKLAIQFWQDQQDRSSGISPLIAAKIEGVLFYKLQVALSRLYSD
jgi:hypothetical protein